MNIFNVIVPGPSHEADEGAAGEEQDERVSQKPRNCLLKERPAQARGERQQCPLHPLGQTNLYHEFKYHHLTVVVTVTVLQHQLKLLEAQKRQQELILRRKTEEVSSCF